jgi:hypothetical protein
MQARLEIDESQVRKAMDKVAKDAPRAIQHAINRTLGNVATQIKKKVSRHYSLKSSTVGESLKISRASARFNHFEGVVRSSGRPIPISQFIGTSVLKRGGVNVRVKRGGSKTRLRHAFSAQIINWSEAGRSGGIVGSAHHGIFMRKKRKDVFFLGSLRASSRMASGGNKAYVGRSPIEEVFGPSVPAQIKNRSIWEPLEQFARDKLKEHLKSRVKEVLRRRWEKQGAA